MPLPSYVNVRPVLQLLHIWNYSSTVPSAEASVVLTCERRGASGSLVRTRGSRSRGWRRPAGTRTPPASGGRCSGKSRPGEGSLKNKLLQWKGEDKVAWCRFKAHYDIGGEFTQPLVFTSTAGAFLHKAEAINILIEEIKGTFCKEEMRVCRHKSWKISISMFWGLKKCFHFIVTKVSFLFEEPPAQLKPQTRISN